MSSPVPGAPSAVAGSGLAADSHSLDRLRSLAEQDPAQAVKQVATQFEAMFVQMVLKSMRESGPKSGLFDSQEEQTYNEMLDQQMAQKVAAGGTGLGAVIARQLSRNLPTAPASGGSAPAAGAAMLQAVAAARAAAAAGRPAQPGDGK